MEDTIQASVLARLHWQVNQPNFGAMIRDLPPARLALLLLLAVVAFRLVSAVFPEVIPNLSPLMAIAFVGAIYLPVRWGWLIGPVALLITDLAFLRLNQAAGGLGEMFSAWTLISLAVYAAAGGLGLWLAPHKSLGKIAAGSVLCSIAFYVASNTFCWWQGVGTGVTVGYAPTLAGWWQANTIGLPGYLPTWYFLRNGILGDLFFAGVLILTLDRDMIFGRQTGKVRLATT